MRFLVGVGATAQQVLPYETLKYSILCQKNKHQFIVENMSTWPSIIDESKAWNKTYGTVFSLQRFILPSVAFDRNFDGFIHLDSDMLALQSLDVVVDQLVADKICIADIAPNSQQVTQSAFFAGLNNLDISNRLRDALIEFYQGRLDYFTLMTLGFIKERLKVISYHFNSREIISRDTIILHMTDVYVQPWVSPYSRFGRLWVKYMNDALSRNCALTDLLLDGIKNGFYRPSLANTCDRKLIIQFINDLFFLPPQFVAYIEASRYLSILNNRALKVLAALVVHTVGFLHCLFKYRRT